MKICVIGAGVSGVSSALRTKQKFPSLDVTIIADSFTPNNTSDGAVGNLVPFLEGTKEELILKWFKETYNHCEKLLYRSPDASSLGLCHIDGTYLFKSYKEFPKWCYWMPGFRELTNEELKQYPVTVSRAFSMKTIVCECSKYIPKMMQEFVNLGGKMLKKKVSSFSELAPDYDIVINCAGLQAGLLANDKTLFPVRGQVVRVHAPWIRDYIAYDVDLPDRISAILPNQDSCVLGVTFQKDNYDTVPSIQDRDWIINETSKIYPSLRSAPILWDWVGLRPGRDGVRLEKEDIFTNTSGNNNNVTVIHNYGHYASGISLHWGCAGDVVKLIEQCLHIQPMKSKI